MHSSAQESLKDESVGKGEEVFGHPLLRMPDESKSSVGTLLCEPRMGTHQQRITPSQHRVGPGPPVSEVGCTHNSMSCGEP
jgi:hypothetical protein